MASSSLLASSFIHKTVTIAATKKGTVQGLQGKTMVECSSRPKKKATSHHMKTRPRKTQPWDINRRPTVYAPLPPLPPDWSLYPSSPSSTQSPAGAPPAEAAAVP